MRLFDYRKKVCRTVSGGTAGRAPNDQDVDPVGETGADVGTKPDCPSAEGSDNMSVTNSEVESAMNHRRCRAVLRDPSSRMRHSMPLARATHTSELLEMGLEEPRSNI